MRAGGVCDVNSLTGLIPPVRPNDQALADLEDSQAPSWECGGYWCTGKWDTVGTHCYSREGQMRGCFMAWAADHVRSERGITQLILLIWIWQACSGTSTVSYSFLFLRGRMCCVSTLKVFARNSYIFKMTRQERKFNCYYITAIQLLQHLTTIKTKLRMKGHQKLQTLPPPPSVLIFWFYFSGFEITVFNISTATPKKCICGSPSTKKILQTKCPGDPG